MDEQLSTQNDGDGNGMFHCLLGPRRSLIEGLMCIACDQVLMRNSLGSKTYFRDV